MAETATRRPRRIPTLVVTIRAVEQHPANESISRSLTKFSTITWPVSRRLASYPLLLDETCWFLACDFDDANWMDDAASFQQTCRELGVPSALERSRSGNGGHVWIFFDRPIPAAQARRLGSFILTLTMERRYQVGLTSYDRFFPNQDTLPKGGFGNLIALPLQGIPRKQGNSLFLDGKMEPHPDQWAYLDQIDRMKADEADRLVREAERTGSLVGVCMSLSDDDDADAPWTLPPSGTRPDRPIPGPFPETIQLVQSNLVYVAARPFQHQLMPRPTGFVLPEDSHELGIQAIYAALASDGPRNAMIEADVRAAVAAGRSPLVLTERTSHVEALAERFKDAADHVIVLRGGTGARKRREIAGTLASIPEGQTRLLIATGRYVGEGFDDARLDTLFLALPISWKGTLQQYAGRLHRLYENKQVVQIYDYIDEKVPVLRRMYEKRLKGYEAIGYVESKSGVSQGRFNV